MLQYTASSCEQGDTMGVMVAYICALVLLLTALVAVTLQKAYFYLPAKELAHRSERGDAISATLLTVATHGAEAQLLLLVVLLLGEAGGLVLLAQTAPALLGVVVTVLVLALGFFWQPRTRLTKYETKLAVWAAPMITWLVKSLHPVLWPFVSWAEGRRVYQRHTKLFDAADFDTLLERQRLQRDSRLDAASIQRMQRGLQFGAKHVGEIMTAKAKVKAVSAEEPLNPVLVDELHKTGHPRFPVYDGKQSNIIGTLAMDAISDIMLSGTVGEHAERRVAYLHEQDTLQSALEAFYVTHQHLFVVLGNKGSYSGIVTLTDIFHALAGGAKGASAVQYEDRNTVLARHASKENM